MELLLLKKYWKHILSILLILVAALSMGSTLYSWGYSNAKEDCSKADALRAEIQTKQTKAIERLSEDVAKMAADSTKQSRDNLDRILSTVKNKPLFTIVDGKCAPTKEFEETYIRLSEEGNK